MAHRSRSAIVAGCLALLALPALAQGARLLSTDASLVHGNSTRRMLGGGGPQDLMQKMNDLMNTFCSYQSGVNCGEIDWTGSSDWWRKYFVTLSPTTTTTGLDAPNVPLSSQTLQQQTVSNFYCPYRNFAYKCRLDKQSFQQTAQTTTHSSGWNVGTTTKATAIFGIEFLGTGGGAGPLVQFSFTYGFQDATASAHTDQTTTVESVTVDMDPAKNQCLMITTTLSVVKATGTQDAYIAVKGYVGTHQDAAHHWRLDANSDEQHYYRATPFTTVVQQAKQANLPGASDWTVVGDEARIVLPFDLSIDFGTSGSTHNNFSPAGSDACNRFDSTTAGSQAAFHSTGGSGGPPVIPAIRLPM